MRYDSYVDTEGVLARITVKSIDEAIGTRQISEGDTVVNYFKGLSKTTKIIIGVIAGVVLLTLGIGYYIYRKKDHKKLGPIFKKKYEKLLKN